MSDYVKMTVKISKEDLKEYLLEYLTEEEIENTNLQSEAIDAINGILQDYFSDFQVYDENCIVWDDKFEPLDCNSEDTWFHPFKD